MFYSFLFLPAPGSNIGKKYSKENSCFLELYFKMGGSYFLGPGFLWSVRRRGFRSATARAAGGLLRPVIAFAPRCALLSGLMNSPAISRELRCLTALIEARARLFDRLVQHAEAHLSATNADRRQFIDMLPLLRSEFCYQICQLFYLLDEHQINTAQKFERLLDRHNRDMTALLADPRRMLIQGLAGHRDRLERSLFSEGQKRKVIESIVGNQIRLDQSDIIKLMAPFMSPESCRKTVVALANGGLLQRVGRVQVLVYSKGDIEAYFREHLGMIADLLLSG
jgi:hypothetical protein